MRNERPFAAAAAATHILETPGRREILARLCEGLGAREPFLFVTGDAGTGKTTLLRDAVAAWGSKVTAAFVTNPALTRKELVEEIARRFGAEPPASGSKPQLLACLERVLSDVASGGRIAVLVIDDAHDLAPELLEELRLIANTESKAGRPFEILLAGLPSLEARISDPELAALRQRIALHGQLKPLSQKETRRHLQEMVGRDGPKLFPRETCREIFRHTHGVPRAVNALADEAMRLVRGKGAAVTVDHVRAAAAACDLTVASGPAELDASADDVAKDTTPEAASPEPAKPRDVSPRERRAETDEAVPPAKDAAPEPVAAKPSEPEPVAVRSEDAASPVTAEKAHPDEPPATGEREDEAAPATAPRPAASGDGRVRDWVARFIAEDEPRFGARFAMGVLDDVQEVVVTRRGGSTTSEGVPAAEVEAAAVPVLEEASEPADDDAPPRRSAPRRARAGAEPSRHRPSHTTQLAIGFVGLAALAAVILLPRLGSRAADHGSARPAASEAAQADDAAAGTEMPTADAAKAPAGREVKSDRSPEPKPEVRETRKPVRPADPEPAARTPSGETQRPASTAATTRSVPNADAASGASQPSATAPEAGEFIALDVGTYINPDRAAYERTRLAAETGLRGWVVEGAQDGVSTYRVVLGTFSSRERAQRSAGLLLSRGLVTEAVMIPLPPRSARR